MTQNRDMVNAGTIIVCEPQCYGFEHALVNAAMLQTIRSAWPDSRIIFFGEKHHLGWVRGFTQKETAIDNITWEVLEIPLRHSANWKRLRAEFRWCRRIITASQNSGARTLIVLSTTNTGLLALKYLLRKRRFSTPTLVVAHACLDDLANPPSARFLRRIISMPSVLEMRHPPSLRLVVLCPSIHRRLKELQHFNWENIDLPYIWARREHENILIGDGSTIRFGYFGVTAKGFEMFNLLADEIAPKYPNAEFVLVGFVNGDQSSCALSPHIHGLSNAPLSTDEYEKRASGLTYCIWAANPEHYRLRASGSFLDAMSFQKPGIYLRNDYVDHYFNVMGDIGYLCGCYEEIRDTMIGIIESFPRERYLAQIENIKKGRTVFEPPRVSIKLRSIVDDISHSNSSKDAD